MLHYEDLPSKASALAGLNDLVRTTESESPPIPVGHLALVSRPGSPFRHRWRRVAMRTMQATLTAAMLIQPLSQSPARPASTARAAPLDLQPVAWFPLAMRNAQPSIEFRVNTYTTDSQRRPSVAMDADGDFVITWESDQDGDWYGIYAQRYSSEGPKQGKEFRVNTYTTGPQMGPSIAIDADGDFVVAWTNNEYPSGYHDISAQRYRSDGTRRGDEFQVNKYLANTDQYNPSVAMDADGDFVVAWEGYHDHYVWGIYMRRYQSNGTPQGNESLVHWGYVPDVAMDADGNFVVVWSDDDWDQGDIHARQYQSDGTPLDGEFPVNMHTTGNQNRPNVAMDADGDFVVAWTSYGQDGDNAGVYARQYQSDGTPLGDEFQVNTHTTGRQRNPNVAMDADGDFVVAWTSYGQDGDSDGVYAQRYRSNGTPLGDEFRLNAYTTGNQKQPNVAMDADGDFVVAWTSYGQDGDVGGVYARWNMGGF
jgi:hypothetical protein